MVVRDDAEIHLWQADRRPVARSRRPRRPTGALGGGDVPRRHGRCRVHVDDVDALHAEAGRHRGWLRRPTPAARWTPVSARGSSRRSTETGTCWTFFRSTGYLSSRDIRRSASGLPPVWQVGQYCRLESAKRHLAHGVAADRAGLAGAAVHREVGLLLALELAGGQPARPLDRVAEDVADRVVQGLQLVVGRGCWPA